MRLQTVEVHTKSMILRRNSDPFVEQVLYGMIGAVMAEFKLVRLSAQGQP